MRRKLLPLLLVTCLWQQVVFSQNDVVNDAGASAYNLNKPEREEWLRNAGSGLFIHFGVDAQLGIVISHSLVGASDDYVKRYFEQLPQTFDPARFDATEFARIAKLAGMQYMVFTTKHHSGFCLWNTGTTPFNSMHTPYGKDMVKEFVTATRKAGLQVGFYFSPEDFNFLYTHHLPITRDNVVMTPAIKKEFDAFTRRQCEELMTQYGKIDVLFIDGEPKEVVKQTCWKLQPDLLITRGALKTPEQMLPGVTITEPWLSCITIGTAWQYQPTNERYKSGTQLIELLIEARSKGGSLLLNTGPEPDGAINADQQNRLREMAAWYFVNHEAVDSVRPWVITNERNIWYTTSIDKKTVYAMVTAMPQWGEGDRKSFVLHSVKSTPGTRVSVLGQNSRIIEYQPGKDVSCKWQQTDTGLVVSVVRAQRLYDDHRWPNPVVIKIEQVLPAIEPLQVTTLGAAISGKKQVTLTGQVFNAASITGLKARFYYRTYKGQIEDLYAGEWIPVTAAIDSKGQFKATIMQLKPGQRYEYKAVVVYNRVELSGDEKIWQQ